MKYESISIFCIDIFVFDHLTNFPPKLELAVNKESAMTRKNSTTQTTDSQVNPAEKTQMTELMRAHLDAVTGGSSHSSWRSGAHQ
jgi:hypothetical protein